MCAIYRMRHAAVIARCPTWWKTCNYCSVLRAKIELYARNCTWSHDIIV